MKKQAIRISLSEARAIAEGHVRADLGDLPAASAQVLRSDYEEAENCWMFFVSEAGNLPVESTLGLKWAHVVSKWGTYSMVEDLSADRTVLRAYLRTLSANFGVQGT